MGEQAYIVTPAINENEDQNFWALETVFEKFSKLFPEQRIKSLHGQMKPQEKSDTFLDFCNHEIDILVSTSVVEVGINVPNATVMAIINPERFGLSSLHQLRGRIGRGKKKGFCFLINYTAPGKSSLERQKVIEETTDGFIIAEEDLKNRREGDLFGTFQSGAASHVLADVTEHQQELLWASEDTGKLIDENSPEIENILEKITNDIHVSSTI